VKVDHSSNSAAAAAAAAVRMCNAANVTNAQQISATFYISITCIGLAATTVNESKRQNDNLDRNHSFQICEWTYGLQGQVRDAARNQNQLFYQYVSLLAAASA